MLQVKPTLFLKEKKDTYCIGAAITMLESFYATSRLTVLTLLLPLQALLHLLYLFSFMLNNSHCIRIAKCGP
jgi:hypothetical protein